MQEKCVKRSFETSQAANDCQWDQEAYWCNACGAWHLTTGIRSSVGRVYRAGLTEPQQLSGKQKRRRPPKWKK